MRKNFDLGCKCKPTRCPCCDPCATASLEWNRVRASFSSAKALEEIGRQLGRLVDGVYHPQGMSLAEEIHVGLEKLEHALEGASTALSDVAYALDPENS